MVTIKIGYKYLDPDTHLAQREKEKKTTSHTDVKCAADGSVVNDNHQQPYTDNFLINVGSTKRLTFRLRCPVTKEEIPKTKFHEALTHGSCYRLCFPDEVPTERNVRRGANSTYFHEVDLKAMPCKKVKENHDDPMSLTMVFRVGKTKAIVNKNSNKLVKVTQSSKASAFFDQHSGLLTNKRYRGEMERVDRRVAKKFKAALYKT